MSKKSLHDEVNALQQLLQSASRTIWENPEAGGEERQASAYYRKLLAGEGFRIVNEAHLENGFCAEYGAGSPVVALLGEYDALPGLSQKCCATRKPVRENAPGHGCGHNLLGAAAATAAIAIKRYLEREKIPGTIRFYGCPEEELLCGKVKMAYYKMFEGCDFAISWHPLNANMVFDGAYLANASVHFDFQGRSSHAAFAPEFGRSALDAVELMNVGVNYLREHVISNARIHYTTDSGGFAPNIVPSKAGSWYYVRAPRMAEVKEILARIEKVAQGAALMTETTMQMRVDYGCCEMQANHSFADLAHENLKQAGALAFHEDELAFAQSLAQSLAPADLERAQKLFGAAGEYMMRHAGSRDLCKASPLLASSDSGDVSFIMPMCCFATACWPLGVAPHTWQATAASGSPLGERGALHAARVLAGVAYDLYNKPGLRETITREFLESRSEYTPMYKES